jgi:hypothetical protein
MCVMALWRQVVCSGRASLSCAREGSDVLLLLHFTRQACLLHLRRSYRGHSGWSPPAPGSAEHRGLQGVGGAQETLRTTSGITLHGLSNARFRAPAKRFWCHRPVIPRNSDLKCATVCSSRCCRIMISAFLDTVAEELSLPVLYWSGVATRYQLQCPVRQCSPGVDLWTSPSTAEVLRSGCNLRCKVQVWLTLFKVHTASRGATGSHRLALMCKRLHMSYLSELLMQPVLADVLADRLPNTVY